MHQTESSKNYMITIYQIPLVVIKNQSENISIVDLVINTFVGTAIPMSDQNVAS